MNMNHLFFITVILGFSVFGVSFCSGPGETKPYRIIVSTDIGGTDFDDYQSLVHLLLYADTLDIEGIISSPYGDGRKEHIQEAIDAYEKDYPNLKTYSERYPTADSLRKITKQGAIDIPGPSGYNNPTEGSEWIVKCARKADQRPLYVLIWGGIEDLAQALHDAPYILPKLRVYFIGGPNKKWSVNAYQYIAGNFPALWMIESNDTYRGWFVGGNQSGNWSNTGFVKTYIKDYGALGHYFYEKGESMKMGDTPSFAFFLKGTPENPMKPGWGGLYVRAWNRPHKVFNRITTEQDSIEQFGVLELRLNFGKDSVSNPFAILNIDRPIQALILNDTARFLFSPKNSSKYDYTIQSNIASLDKLTGSIIAYPPPVSDMLHPSTRYPNWWTDDLSPELMEDGHFGIKTVNIWREEFLTGFAVRMKRCASAK
jgi:hypothetical protein